MRFYGRLISIAATLLWSIYSSAGCMETPSVTETLELISSEPINLACETKTYEKLNQRYDTGLINLEVKDSKGEKRRFVSSSADAALLKIGAKFRATIENACCGEARAPMICNSKGQPVQSYFMGNKNQTSCYLRQFRFIEKLVSLK